MIYLQLINHYNIRDFKMSCNDDDNYDGGDDGLRLVCEEESSDVDQEWDDFIISSAHNSALHNNDSNSNDYTNDMYKDFVKNNKTIPNASPLTISTKSKEVWLGKDVDLNVFWNIPLIPYDSPETGILKKQMLIKCKTPEEFEIYSNQKTSGISVPGCNYMQELLKKHMDVQKVKRRYFNHLSIISYGICSKDFTKKNKQAFRNCFMLIIRLYLPTELVKEEEEEEEEDDDSENDNDIQIRTSASTTNTGKIFHEYHVKVFNSGKIAFVGVKSDLILKELVKIIVNTLKTCSPDQQWKDFSTNIDDYEQVKILVNSNFKCGFCINQHKLRQIFTTKYNSMCIFNAGNQYTGLRTKYYYDTSKSPEEQTGLYIMTEDSGEIKTNRMSKLVSYPSNIIRVSYSIFRTGSVLISGKCDDDILMHVYRFIANLIKTEFEHIYMGDAEIKVKKYPKNKKHLKVYANID